MKRIIAAVISVILALALPAGTAFAESAFDDIFIERRISRYPGIFLNRDYYAYALAMPDGVVDLNEYGVDGDQVCHWIETIYLPVAGMDENMKSALERDMRMRFSAVEEMDFCTVDSWIAGDYLAICVVFNWLEKPENVKMLAETGLIEAGIETISLSITEENLLMQGYVKDDIDPGWIKARMK